jgi:hypothetical protein
MDPPASAAQTGERIETIHTRCGPDTPSGSEEPRKEKGQTVGGDDRLVTSKIVTVK